MRALCRSIIGCVSVRWINEIRRSWCFKFAIIVISRRSSRILVYLVSFTIGPRIGCGAYSQCLIRRRKQIVFWLISSLYFPRLPVRLSFHSMEHAVRDQTELTFWMYSSGCRLLICRIAGVSACEGGVCTLFVQSFAPETVARRLSV